MSKDGSIGSVLLPVLYFSTIIFSPLIVSMRMGEEIFLGSFVDTGGVLGLSVMLSVLMLFVLVGLPLWLEDIDMPAFAVWLAMILSTIVLIGVIATAEEAFAGKYDDLIAHENRQVTDSRPPSAFWTGGGGTWYKMTYSGGKDAAELVFMVILELHAALGLMFLGAKSVEWLKDGI